LHLLYGYEDIQQWSNAVQPDKAVIEAETAKQFFDYFSVAGLILKGINYGYDFVSVVNFKKNVLELNCMFIHNLLVYFIKINHR